MNTFTHLSRLEDEAIYGGSERVLLLEEVNFKWLLAGLGWWIDMFRFENDRLYAVRFLELAQASDCAALRDSAASLKRQFAVTGI